MYFLDFTCTETSFYIMTYNIICVRSTCFSRVVFPALSRVDFIVGKNVRRYTSCVGKSVICKCTPLYVPCKSRSVRGSTSETCICTATFS